jgi:hypothetical protein
MNEVSDTPPQLQTILGNHELNNNQTNIIENNQANDDIDYNDIFQMFADNDPDILEDQHNQNNTTQQVITQPKDNLPFGDVLDYKEPDTIRIYLKNINGIKNYNSWLTWTTSCLHLQKSKVDIFGTTETNINWNNKIQDEARSQCQQHYQSALINTASSIEHTKTSYQPGGTATVLTNKLTGRSTKTIQDGGQVSNYIETVPTTTSTSSLHIDQTSP